MKSTMQRTLAACLLLALPGCTVFGTRPLVIAPDTPCASLVPAAWTDPNGGVTHTADPAPAPPKPATLVDQLAWTLDELKKWTGFAVGEAQKVEDANGRTRDSVKIIADCEARDAAAVKAATKRGLFK